MIWDENIDTLKMGHIYGAQVVFSEVCAAHEVVAFEKDKLTSYHSLYVWSVGSEETEKIVYVGKRGGNSNNTRFRSGHSVATKLLNPNYDGFAKNVYFGTFAIYCLKKNDGIGYNLEDYLAKINITNTVHQSEQEAVRLKTDYKEAIDKDNRIKLKKQWKAANLRSKRLANLYEKTVDWIETVMISDWWNNPPRAEGVDVFEMFNIKKRLPRQENAPIIECLFKNKHLGGVFAGLAPFQAGIMTGGGFRIPPLRRITAEIEWEVQDDED